MIHINNLSLTIKKDAILNDINLHIKKGRITGLVGRNGCGKTMLMKCITGFVKPTEGEVIFDNKKIGVDVDFPDNVGIIIETPSFVPYYSGMKNLIELASLKRIIGKKFVNGFPVRFLDIAFFRVYNNENNKTCDKKGGFSWTQVIVAVPMCRTEVVNCVCGTVDPLRPV